MLLQHTCAPPPERQLTDDPVLSAHDRELQRVQLRGGAEIFHFTSHSVDLPRSDTVGTKERVAGHAIVAVRMACNLRRRAVWR